MGEVVAIEREAMAEAVREMEASDGWECVKTFLEARISDHLKQLEYCPVEKVEQHREAVRAFRSVFTHLEELKALPTE